MGISSLASISWLEEDTACLSTTREKRNVKKATLLLYWGTISQAVPPNYLVQATTVIVDTVIVESTALVEQKTLTTQFYLLLVESPL